MRFVPSSGVPAALVLVAAAAVGPALAHSGHVDADQDQPAPKFKMEKVSEHVYCLFGRGGNVGILTTDAGVLLVDDQYGDIAPGLLEQVRTVSDKPIRFLVNTHYHGDHTGGNFALRKSVTEIVAHDTVRPRLLEYPAQVQKDFPPRIQSLQNEIAGIKDEKDAYRDALSKNLDLMKFFLDDMKKFNPAEVAPPDITFDHRVTLWLGDQPVEVFHVAPGHTDGDALVWFRKEKVIHMGDLLFNGLVPFIDTDGGGSGLGYVKNLDAVLDMVPSDTRVIAGHGPVGDVASVRHMRDFLKEMQVQVEAAVKKGLSRPEAARTIRLEAYADIKPAFRAVANDVLVFYDEVHAR